MPNKYLIAYCNDSSLSAAMPQVDTETKNKDNVIYAEYSPGGKLSTVDGVSNIDTGTHLNAIVMYGSHGDVDTSTKLPKELNGLKNGEDLLFIKKLKDKQVTADLVVLDCCLTVSYLNHFYDILTDEGVFVSSVPTLTGASMAATSLPVIKSGSTSFCNAFESAHNTISAMGLGNPYGVFFKDSDKLHRCDDNMLLMYAICLQEGADDFNDIKGNLERLTGKYSADKVKIMAQGLSDDVGEKDGVAKWRHVIKEEVEYNDTTQYINGIKGETGTW